VLVPTDREAELLFADDPPAAPVAICGFGLAEAGAGAATAIAAAPGDAAGGVVLIGAAGTYDAQRAPIGSALVAGRAELHGIGARGQSPAALGFSRDDVAELDLRGHPDGGTLLSVAQSSGDRAEAARRSSSTGAVAEEMEAYAVAVAARLQGVPLTVVRGISNAAGEPNISQWRLPEALHAARDLLREIER
jgi:futalosine hydrolase